MHQGIRGPAASTTFLRTVLTTVLALLVSTAGLLVVTPLAVAAPGAPTGLTADGAVPRLAWARVSNGAQYDVEVSEREDFATRVWTRSTVNDQVVPDVVLPAGTLYWRVRARDSSGTGDWTSDRVIVGAGAAPTIVAPADGAVVSQPDEPALLRWSAVAGATGYVLQVSDDPDFVDPARIKEYRSKGISHVVDAGLPGTTYYWRVRVDRGNGLLGPLSRTATYTTRGLGAPVLTAPVNDAASPITEVVLDWQPVPGAERYDVRVSTDQNFNGAVPVRTVATRWSPPITLDNDQYYWQVRPVDTFGVETPWTSVQTWRFRRSWPDQPRPIHPVAGSTVGDPLFLEWAPATLASHYRVQLSADPNFPGTTELTGCLTRATTLVLPSSNCTVPSGDTLYWRVVAYDAPGNVVSDWLNAPVASFRYRPDRATPTAPANGASVEVPTLRWSPARGAEKYRVTVTPVGGGRGLSVDTTTTSFTPRTRLDPGTYRWDVQTISSTSAPGLGLLTEAQRQFVVVEPAEATAPTPEPVDPVLEPTDRFPTLRWTPVREASHYQLRIRRQGADTWRTPTTSYSYPAGEEITSDFLGAGGWEYQVQALKGSALLATGSVGRFSIASSEQITGHRAAPTGTATGDPATTCDMGLPSRCQDLDQTPVVRWDPVPGASYYRVQVTFDRERTNVLPRPLAVEFVVHQPMWVHEETLPDSQAGSAYFVSFRPCKTADETTCGPARSAGHAFNKLSKKVELRAPAADAMVSDDVTFTWRDYLATNRDPATGTDVTGVQAQVEARGYEVEISTDQTFTDVTKRVEPVATVDQTTYTVPGTTLPEGPVFWRVRAVDGSANGLVWSDARRLEKRSPVPSSLTPAAGTSVAGGQPFRWAALPFAGAYEIEVFQGATTVVSATRVEQPAFTTATPLPAGSDYRWRVRRLDAAGRRGEWSTAVGFTVRSAVPVLQSPATGADVAPAGALFTWTAVPGAARYQFQRSQTAGGTSSETFQTVATAYAPLGRVVGGSHQWRVVALDGAGKELGATAWRAFTVQDRPTAAAPTVTGSPRIGNSLFVAEPTWSMPVDSESVQWLRNGQPIPGATGLQYDVGRDDLDKTLSARITATRAGYADGTVTSAGVRATRGSAPGLLATPVLEGPARVGTDLTVDPPDWDHPDVTTLFQWMRNGATIRGATTATYAVLSSDVGAAITLRITGQRAGYDDAVVTTAARTVTAGSAPRALTPPGVVGSTVVGGQVSATPGEWSTTGLKFEYQWFRDQTAITGATSSAYRLTAADAGRAISARVTTIKTGYAAGVATSAARTVAKIVSTTTATPSRTTARTRQAVQVAVGVAASGAIPTGAVQLLVNGRQVTSSQLRSGRTTLRYVPRSPGSFRLTVRYVGQGPVAASTSRQFTLRVTR